MPLIIATVTVALRRFVSVIAFCILSAIIEGHLEACFGSDCQGELALECSVVHLCEGLRG